MRRVYRFFWSVFALLLGTIHLSAQQQCYTTQAIAPEVKTLQVGVVGRELVPPIIELGSGEQIEISFDRLLQDANSYSYTLVHCNADWTPSNRSTLEYVDGFNLEPVEYEEYSYNTFMPYTHYRIEVPNSQMQITSSGNYAIRVFPTDDPDNTLLNACFSVYESCVGVTTHVSSITDIDHNAAHQQVEVLVDYARYPVSNPYADFKLYVSQNGRRDNEVVVNTPLSVRGGVAEFAHNRALIFEAGNEYRRFEMVNLHYAGIGVEAIEYFDPIYHVTLHPTVSRAHSAYSYDQTQQGRYVIRQSEASDSDLEADYFMVHFALASDQPFIEGAVYLDGYFTQNGLNDSYKMRYNFETLRYERDLLLKQGSYNYHYLYVPHGKQQATTALMEGNYSETNNEYLAKVYYRPFGKTYDLLIGVGLTRFGE